MREPQLNGNHIGGTWRPSLSGLVVCDEDPGDLDDPLGYYPESGQRDVELAVASATSAGCAWRAMSAVERGRYLRGVAALLDSRTAAIAKAITKEVGKTYTEAEAEVRRSVEILDFFAGEGRRIGGRTLPADDPRTVAMTFRQPIGVVALITPWNFPLAIPVWKIAPALLSGCTAVLKASPLAPGTAALLASAFQEVGLPAGTVNLVQGGRPAGAALVSHPGVAGVSFTGSVPVGREVNAAAADRLSRTQLELGGKNAALVLADADLELAANAVVAGAFGQAGQRCSATSRIVIQSSVYEQFLDRITTRSMGLTVGYGLDDQVDMGPVITADRVDTCLAAVTRATSAGAVVACGGKPVTGYPRRGHYLEPTVLVDVEPGSQITREELFGPVLVALRCNDFSDGMSIVNSVPNSMSCAVFSTDHATVFEAVNRAEAGMIHVNRPGVGAYAHLPHTGSLKSQLGPPECSSHTWDFYTSWRSACINY